MEKLEFIRKIPKLKQVYMIVSNLTKQPFVETNEETFDDQVYFFDTEEGAKKKAEDLGNKKNPVSIVLIDDKHMLANFSSLYALGVNAIMVELEGESQLIQLKNLVTRESKNKRPVENPQLQLSMIYYMQAVRAGMDCTDPAYQELEEEMVVNFMRASYYMDFVKTETEDGKTIMNVNAVKLKNGKQMIPLFTDYNEVVRFTKKQGVPGATFKLEQLMQQPLPDEVDGYIINPASISVPLPKGFLESIHKNVENFKQN